MNIEIYNDEIKALSKKASEHYQKMCNLAHAKRQPAPVIKSKNYVFSDGTVMEDCLVPALASAKDGECLFVDVFDNSLFTEQFVQNKGVGFNCTSMDDIADSCFEDTAFILLIDAKKANSRWYEIIDFCVQKAKNSTTNKIVVSILLPEVRTIPEGIEKLEEREYSFFLEKTIADLTNTEKFVIDIETACRKSFKDINGAQMSLLRFDNIFGGAGTSSPAYDIKAMVEKAFKDGEVIINKQDHLVKFSCMYARDAAMSVLAGLRYGKNGHVYNVTNYCVTVADFKETLQKLFPDKIALKTDGLTYSKNDVEKHCLSSLKFMHEQIKMQEYLETFENALYFSVCCWMNIPFDVMSQLDCYEGKLDRLKTVEIDILMEIDRICRKHNIKYFLAGGSCLGAIRNNKSIPWDDDLDLGMLREDYEKFRKVAPQELGEKFIYSSHDQDENCHYYFDKIRLKDTYFSTFYSNKFVLADGVFVDIVVYDQTTTNVRKCNRQIKRISFMIKLINLRWHGYPIGSGITRLMCALLLPFMKLIPFEKYHKWYDKLATKYKKLKNAKYVLDGGLHLVDGPFLKESISEIEYTKFDNMEQAPIPTGYKEYLTFLYGPNFRPEPNISSRLAAHKIARLDLGKYIFDSNGKQDFRAVDIRGELFENEE